MLPVIVATVVSLFMNYKNKSDAKKESTKNKNEQMKAQNKNTLKSLASSLAAANINAQNASRSNTLNDQNLIEAKQKAWSRGVPIKEVGDPNVSDPYTGEQRG